MPRRTRTAAQIFDKLEGESNDRHKSIRFDATGGTESIRDPQSPYRRHLEEHILLYKFKLCFTCALICVNCVTILHHNTRDLHTIFCMMKMADSCGTYPSKFELLCSSVAIIEIGGLTMLIMLLIHRLLGFVCGTPKGFSKWFHLCDIAWVRLRALSKFSSIMFVGSAHPGLVLEDYKQFERRYGSLSKWHLKIRIICFVLERLLAITFGIAGLAVKAVRIANHVYAAEIQSDVISLLACIFFTAAVLNQALNMVDITHRLRMRTLSFVFAGSDGLFQQVELFYVDAYCARVAKTIWDTCEGRFNAFAALAAFNYQDVQRLAIIQWPRGLDEVLPFLFSQMWA